MALTTAQQALLLFKKWLGLGQTTASREFFNETSFPGRSAVYTNQIWTQADLIPNTAPVLTNGQTSGVVQYWVDVTLGAAAGTTNAFTSSLLIDAIPFNYGDGTSYNYTIKDSTNASIAFGQGDWILDTDAGLLTFYSTVPSNMPPKVSFYRYVGAKGFTSASIPLTGSLFGTASWASNAISSSFATSASAATSITFIPSTASFATTSSFAVTASYALNSTELPPNLVSSSTQIDYTQIQNKPTTIETASYVEYNNVANKPALVSSSQQINTGSFSGSFVGTFTGSTLGTASIANQVTGGENNYIPLWAQDTTLSSSLLYQTGSSVLLGATTQHTPEAPDRFGVFAGVTDSYNLISAHGEIDSYLQINIKNFSAGLTASSDVVVTADTGDELSGFINLGINSSNYAVSGAIGGPLDAYLYSTGSNLLIGNTSPNKKIILFTGGGDAINNARVFIDPSGSVGINTSEVIEGAPDALRVRAVPSAETYNVITALGLTDDYAQINMKNTGVGNSVSSDIVATANNGDENTNFVNMGINGETYTGTLGGPNDSYVYSTGGHLHLGAIDPGEEVMLFVGSSDTTLSTKLTLRDTNQHELSGSLNVTGSLNVLQNVVNNLTASFAVSASYVEGAASDWNTLANKPDGIVSSSTQVQNYNIFATTGSNTFKASQTITGSLIVTDTITAQQFNIEFISSSVIYESGSTKFGDSADDTHQFTGSLSVLGTISGSLVLPTGILSSSTQFNALTGTSASFATTASAATSITFTPTTASFSTTASAATSITFTPSTASFATTASAATSITFTPSSASFATTSSAATSITFTPSTASFATTSSFVLPSGLPSGIISSSGQVNGTQITNNTITIGNTSTALGGTSTTITGLTSITATSITGSLTGSFVGSLNGTASWASNAISSSFATTASAATSITFVPATASFATTSSAATSITFTPSTASFATTSSAATSITFTPSTASFATTASAATSITFTPSTASFATTSSFAQNAQLLNNTSSAILATTGSNSFNGTQTISGSLLLTTDIVVFSGSFTTSGSFAISGSLGVTNGITGSLFGTSSWAQNVISSSFATTASAATSITFTPSSASFSTTSSFATTASAANSITFTPASASFATTSSFAQNARLLNNTGSATFATTGSNTFNGTQTITGSLLLASDTVTFTGSFTTSGSFTVSGSLGVSGGITGSLLGSSSFATTASAATSITFTPTSASFATTASAANSITFIPSSASFATTASAATSITFTPTSASFATTSSYAVTASLAISASFIDGGFY